MDQESIVYMLGFIALMLIVWLSGIMFLLDQILGALKEIAVKQGWS